MSKWTARGILAGIGLVAVSFVMMFFQFVLFLLGGIITVILSLFGLKYLFGKAK